MTLAHLWREVQDDALTLRYVGADLAVLGTGLVAAGKRRWDRLKRQRDRRPPLVTTRQETPPPTDSGGESRWHQRP